MARSGEILPPQELPCETPGLHDLRPGDAAVTAGTRGPPAGAGTSPKPETKRRARLKSATASSKHSSVRSARPVFRGARVTCEFRTFEAAIVLRVLNSRHPRALRRVRCPAKGEPHPSI